MRAPPVSDPLNAEAVRALRGVGLEDGSTAHRGRRLRRDSDELTASVGGRRAYQAVAGVWQYARGSGCRRGSSWCSGGARGGSRRRRASASSGGLELAIRAAPTATGEIDRGVFLSEGRGVFGVKKGGADRPYL
jgi:hypothetical protein